MGILEVIKGIGAIGGLFTAGKIYYDIITGSKGRLREEYKFAKEFMQDTREEDLQPFVLEKGYQALAGTTKVTASEVSYIISLKNPAQSLKDYILAKKYLTHSELRGKLEIDFKPKYKSKWSRYWRMCFYLSSYLLLAVLALSPLLIGKDLSTKDFNPLTALFFTLPFFGVYAFASVRSFSKLYRGQKLVGSQEKATQSFIV